MSVYNKFFCKGVYREGIGFKAGLYELPAFHLYQSGLAV